MRLARLYLSEARLYYCRWLDWRGLRLARKGLFLIRAAEVVRRRERLYLGIAPRVLGLWRPPAISGRR